MKNNPLVSIITPTYNHEKYIGKCIESVSSQTYQNWEQIIIDDGSTDKTPEIIKQYKDPRIRYVRQKNLSIWRLAKTYNKVLNLSKGEFVAVLEGDDFWPEKKLEKQLPCFENNKVVLTWGKGGIVDAGGTVIGEIPLKDFQRHKTIYQNIPKGNILKKLLLENPLTAATVMVRKNVLLEIGGFKQPSLAPYVDYPTWLEMSLKGEFRFINEIMGYWRQHSSQATAKMFKEQMIGHAQIVNEFYRKLPPDLKKSLKINYKLIKGNNCWLRGKAELINKEWQGSRKELAEAVLSAPFLIKLKSILGLVISFFHADLEKIAKFKRFLNGIF